MQCSSKEIYAFPYGLRWILNITCHMLILSNKCTEHHLEKSDDILICTKHKIHRTCMSNQMCIHQNVDKQLAQNKTPAQLDIYIYIFTLNQEAVFWYNGLILVREDTGGAPVTSSLIFWPHYCGCLLELSTSPPQFKQSAPFFNDRCSSYKVGLRPQWKLSTMLGFKYLYFFFWWVLGWGLGVGIMW